MNNRFPWLSQLKLATRLGAVFCVVILLTVLMGVFSIAQLGTVKNTANELSQRWMPSIRVVEDIKSQVARVRTREFQYIISTEVAEMAKYDGVIANDLKDLRKMTDEYEALIATPGEREKWAAFQATWQRYLAEDAKIRAAARADDDAQEKALMRGESNKLIVSLRKQVDDMVEYYTAGGKEAAALGEAVHDRSRKAIAFWLVVVAALSAAGAWAVTRSLVSELGGEPSTAVAVANRIAAGDLTVPVEVRRGDTHSLMFAMKAMRDNLANIVGEVRGATTTISTAAQQVAEGNIDLSARTEQQAGSLEETAASMEELNATVRRNADSAIHAARLAATAASTAQQGGQAVSQVVDTMGNINTAARQIVDIISVIDGIAFQTNILALNAAVEAARAGEQGRGFAVVASEVRNLAQRSAAAAKEIKGLIDNSVQQVELGSKLVSAAGGIMEQVVASVDEVKTIIREISAASAEQTAGIAQVTEAVTQMDAATQQNAELVNTSAAAAGSLQDQVASLAQLIQTFTVAAPARVLPGRQGWAALAA